jgi:cyclophilin family peptidyl-prolyl cis-trans isomerase
MQWRTSEAVGHNDESNPASHGQGGSFVKARVVIIALVALFVTFVLPVGAQQPTPPAPKEAPKGGKKVKQTAVITMEKGGEIALEFFPEDAPKTVENFVTLAKKGYYDGVTFHRVEPNFVVQGGDPKGNGTGGPGYTIKDEFNKQKHVRGVLAMARTQAPNSAGSQFYITLAPAHFLDGQYTVFGRVTSGMEIVDKIKVGDKMKSVKITEVPQ